MIDDAELARRSVLGFGEMIAALGRWGVGPEAEVRRPDAIGARIEVAAENPWFDAVVVPLGSEPPIDDPSLPHCLWTLGGSAPGRVEDPEIATPCLGVAIEDLTLDPEGEATDLGTPSLTLLGEINERAYGQPGAFVPLVSPIVDDRVRTYGFLVEGVFVCVALTLTIGDDLSIQYVATEADHRRQGLASRLLQVILTRARLEGLSTATLQASPDGLGVYQRLGFRRVATLRGYLRGVSTNSGRMDSPE